MNEIATVEGQAGVPTITYTREQLDLIKRTYAVEATDDELALFVHASKRLSLDILARQIHFTKRAGKVVFIVSIDGYRLNAERTGTYAPGKEPTYAYDDKGAVISATAYGKKFIKGEWHEVAATAFMEEYKPDEKSDWMWRKMPHNQLAKCAEALMLRKGWPKDLGDTVTEDEMAQVREPGEEKVAPPVAKPAAKATPKTTEVEFVPADVEVHKGTSKKTGKPYTKYGIKAPSGTTYGTFDTAVADEARRAKEEGLVLVVTFSQDGKFFNAEAAAIKETQPA